MAKRDDQGRITEIEFHYQKSPIYRTVHADGAYGGNTPSGYIAVTFYSERSAIPRNMISDVTYDEQGQPSLGPERQVEGLEGVMRQLEVSVMLDINSSRNLYSWLRRHLGQLETQLGIPEDERVIPTAEQKNG
jgi:hypothetical protein